MNLGLEKWEEKLDSSMTSFLGLLLDRIQEKLFMISKEKEKKGFHAEEKRTTVFLFVVVVFVVY